jgi:chorismate mutase
MNRLRVLAAIGMWALTVPALGAPRAPGFSPAEVGRVDRLLQLIQKRLELAPAIAETRWKTMSRIENSTSEQTGIDAVRARSVKLGLDAELAARFARAQIDAGKIIQTGRHREWAADTRVAPARDTTANVFQASTPEPEFSATMLRALRDAVTVLRRRGGRSLLDARAADLIHVGGPDLLAGQAALKPLYDIAGGAVTPLPRSSSRHVHQ